MIYEVLRKLISSDKLTKSRAKILLIAMSPLWAGIFLDLIFRVCMHNAEMPFFSIIFLQTTIVFLIFTLASEIYNVYKRANYLNTQLQQEVDLQTQSLSKTNQKLEEEMNRSKMDLEMAAEVQKKSIPLGNQRYKGWDISSVYLPCSVVSGDLFDFYSSGIYNEKLSGGGLFDVSGHGLSAGLVTILSRDIVERSFNRGAKFNKPAVQILNDINERFNHSKGNIDNYLTGILFKSDDFDSNDVCPIELANAGHPHPLLYSAKNKTVTEIKPADGENYFGAIGIQDIQVSYSTADFSMAAGDILFCFTDGITDALNEKKEDFGKQRLIDFILSNANKSSSEIAGAFEQKIKAFMGKSIQNDDISLLVLKRSPSKDFFEEI